MFARPGLCGTGIGRLGLVAASRNAFSPLSLFSAGEQGAWYDPSDMSTLFQDSAGTTPVTAVEQPVGLILDKSSTAAPVATIVDPSFDNAARWSPGAGWAVTGGNAVATAAASNVNMLPSGTGYTATVSGAAYKATVDITSVTSGSISLIIWNGSSNVASSAIFTAPGTYQLIYTANNTQCRPYLTTNATNTTLVVASLTQVSVPGNHLIQPTATSRPTLSSRYNLLTKTEQFDDAVWTKTTGTTVTASSATAPDGTLTADTVAYNGTGASGSYRLYSGVEPISITGAGYTAKVWLRADAPVTIAISGNTVAGGVTSVNVTTDWQQFTISGTGNGVSVVQFLIYSPAGSNAAFQVYAWGASVTNASDAALPYQRVNTATDYDYDFSKFPPYLKFDGVDDSMYSAASVDFTSTDKMTVFAGVHKASDASAAVLLETSANFNSNSGTVSMFVPDIAAARMQFGSRGTASSYDIYYKAAPATVVFTGAASIANDYLNIRANGASVASVATDQGTGNYGNYPLYVGRRNNASLPFNGRLYQLALKGKSMTAAEITTVESYINSKTKAY